MTARPEDFTIVGCEACGTEGRVYHGQYDDGYSEPCACCEGTGGEIVPVEPITEDEAAYLAGAAAALGDRHATPPVFFSEKIEAAIAGKSPDEQLQIIADMIADAQVDKAAGYGPPQSEIHSAIRRWNQLYETWVAERLPSTARKDKAA